MTKIYEQFDAATRNLSAWAILADGKPAGRVVIKTGNGIRTWAYVQVWGAEMVRAHYDGYGSDVVSEAVSLAAAKLQQLQHPDDDPKARANLASMRAALTGSSDFDWRRRLEDAGFVLANVTG